VQQEQIWIFSARLIRMPQNALINMRLRRALFRHHERLWVKRPWEWNAKIYTRAANNASELQCLAPPGDSPSSIESLLQHGIMRAASIYIPCKEEMRSSDAAQLGEQNRLDIAFARERSCSFLARLLLNMTAGLRNCDQILSNWHCHHIYTLRLYESALNIMMWK
jgi:hypothetical protein